MDSDTEQRLLKVESDLAHLEHQYDQLNKIVTEQDKTITRLQYVIDRIDQSIREQEMNQVRDNNTKPPHYGPGM